MHWIVKNYKNETKSEKDISWAEIRKFPIKKLWLVLDDGKTLCLPESKIYFQGKTASADLSNNSVKTISRYIGCVLGNNILKITVTGTEIKVELNKYDSESKRQAFFSTDPDSPEWKEPNSN